MKYKGSKNRLAKYLKPIFDKTRIPNSYYVEPFVGGANMIDKMDGKKIGADINPYLIALLKQLQTDWKIPYISEEDFKHIMLNKKRYPDYLVGYVMFPSSFNGLGKSYAKTIICKTTNRIRDYQKEAINNLTKQRVNLKNINFICTSYVDLKIPINSTIYCDIPYKNTSGYNNTNFNHAAFFEWAREKSKNHFLYISEYEAPKDFINIFKKVIDAKTFSSKPLFRVEKLFIHESKIELYDLF